MFSNQTDPSLEETSRSEPIYDTRSPLNLSELIVYPSFLEQRAAIDLFRLTLTWATGDAQPPGITDQLHRVLIHLHQTNGINIGQNPAVEATGADLPKNGEKQKAEENRSVLELPLSGNLSLTSTEEETGKTTPNRPHLSVQVCDAAVALRGSVELADLLDAEALGEVLPYGGSQTIAHCQPHAVLGF